ncbi:MAG: arylesterase [Burkholderiales bacterium]|nr:MAG: arylesterase [Burkholderiales bacterium]
MSGLRRRAMVAHCSVGLLAGWSSGVLASAAEAPVILVVGDSLSAEYGLKAGDGWVALLQKRLDDQKKPHRVVNASISGDTTAGGRSRLPTALRTHKPAIVVIELGGNDALRGLPLASTRDNLVAMAQAAQAAGAKVIVVGMQVPPNYGSAYARDFEGLFATVARDVKAGFVPFLLKGVADRPDAMDWFQPDRIHPLAKAHPQMLDNVWPALKPLL